MPYQSEAARNDLFDLLRRNAPIIWLGHGMSHAVCALASKICINNGIESQFSTPERAADFASHKVIEVSASGRALSDKPLLTLSSLETQNRSAETDAIFEGLPANPTWTGIEFAEACTLWLRSLFNLGEFKNPEFENVLSNHPAAQFIILIDGEYSVMQYLVGSIDGKVPNLNFRVTGLEQFGHGLHHLVWREANNFTVIILESNNSINLQANKVIRWLSECGTSWERFKLNGAPTSSMYLIEMFSLVLDLISFRSTALGIGPESKPMPAAFDTLR